MKVLILGGYGVFGGRLAELLADEPDLELVIVGRDATKASRFCEQHKSVARMTPIPANRSDIEHVLQSVMPDILVDASGPFQEYGDSRYEVVEACIRNSVHYLDLADAPDFVLGIDQLNDAAKEADVFVLSGLSSFPVLTAAVLRELENRMSIRTVIGGIAPSPYAGVGQNVMRAVLGYSGKAVKLTRDGEVSTGIGLVETKRYTISPPGHLPVANLRYSLVDIPDLQLIPRQFPSVSNIWVGAGPVPEFLHRMLNLLAYIRWLLRLPSLAPSAPLCNWVMNTFRYGEHRGGMFIQVTDGSGDGRTLSWHLLAERDDGPYIPSMAAEIVIRKTLNGQRPDAGARPGTTAVTLSDYDKVFKGREIYTGVRETSNISQPIFREVLGECFGELPERIQALHSGEESSDWHGRVMVKGARGLLGRAIARIFGFPSVDAETDAHVAITPTDRGEIWVRTFGMKVFRSELSLGDGRAKWLVCERFGLISISIALVWRDNKLWYVPRRWSLGPIPLPKFLMPAGRSFEYDQNGDFGFDVTIEAPIFGLIAGYKGTLRRVEESAGTKG